MNPSAKIFGINWDTSGRRWKWQFTSQNYLRVDVTDQFDSRYCLIAYRQFHDEEAEKLRTKLKSAKWALSCGQDGFKGETDHIWKHTTPPGDAHIFAEWRVSNCCHLLPGKRHDWGLADTSFVGNDFSDTFGPHPSDGYAVQFNAVPWGVFTRYWRKPIHLDRRFHTAKRKSGFGKNRGYAVGSASIEVLDFDVTLLRTHKTFFADFSFLYSNRTRTHDVNMALWMLENVGGFRIMSDHDSPFVRIDDEVLFSIECM